MRGTHETNLYVEPIYFRAQEGTNSSQQFSSFGNPSLQIRKWDSISEALDALEQNLKK